MKKLTFLFLFFPLLLVSCGPKPEEQVKEFAGKFGDFVNINQKDSVQKYYPAFQLTDSLATLPLSNIIVSPEETEGHYIIEYSPQTQVLAKIDDKGSISVVESRGLFAFDQEKIDLAKKTGMVENNLSDLELALKMNDNDYFNFLKSKTNLNDIITIGKFVKTSDEKGYYVLKNNSSRFINGVDYELIINSSTPYYVEEAPLAVAGWKKVQSIESGLDIEPNGEVKYYSPIVYTWVAGEIGPEKKIKKIQWKLSPEQLQEQFASYTGNEYQEYLDSKK